MHYYQQQTEQAEQRAFQLVHALKGCASYIADNQLSEAVEHCLEIPEHVQWSFVPRVAERLAVFLALQPQHEHSPEQQTLVRLERLIRQHNFSAINMVNQLLNNNKTPLTGEQLEQILHYLKGFDFNSALHYLKVNTDQQ